ncbi:MAG: CPBP family intramembrane glutamic endopeptidase [Acidobacteriaceae bacterium]
MATPAPEPLKNAPDHAAARLSSPFAARHPALYGASGLRVGWRIALYLGLLLALLLLANFEFRWVAARTRSGPFGAEGGAFHPMLAILGEAGMLLAVLAATAAMARMEQRPVASYGLAGTQRVRQFLIGLASGFCFLSLLVGILALTHHLDLNRPGVPFRQALTYASAWGLCFLLVGLTEELMFRGYLLFTLADGIRFWPAAFLLAALFGFLHKGNNGESQIGLVAAGLVAMVFSLSLWRLGHLWWAIGFHTAWDWAESFFYGTADSGVVSAGRLMRAHPHGAALWSGGATGPEGSLWVLPVLLLAILFVWLTQPKRNSSFR